MTDREKWEELVTFVSRDWPDNCIDRKISGKYYLDAILYADRRLKALEKVMEAAEEVERRLTKNFPERVFIGKDFTIKDCTDLIRAALAAAKEDG